MFNTSCRNEVSCCDDANFKKMTNIFTLNFSYILRYFSTLHMLVSTLHSTVRLHCLLKMIISYHSGPCIILLGLRILCLKHHHWPLQLIMKIEVVLFMRNINNLKTGVETKSKKHGSQIYFGQRTMVKFVVT